MPRPAATQKTRAAIKHQCGSCDEIFTGKTCPNCGEKNDIFPINAEGIPLDEVANAVGSTHSLPINLTRTPEFDPDFELEAATRREMKDVMQDAQLDKIRASAAIQAAKRLRAEKELEATEKGFIPPNEGKETNQTDASGNMSSAMFMQALGGWQPEARETLFDRLKTDPEFAFNLSRLLNPQPGMPQLGMMNPMGMMGAMMQPPVEQAPQTSAADMLTAVIAAVASIREMSGGDKGDSAQMDRLLDKMDEMRKESEAMKLQLVEAQNAKSNITTEDIRGIVADVMANATKGKVGLLNGLEEIHAVKDQLIGLGIASEPNAGVDPAQTLEERKFDHQIKMDDRRDRQEHELRLKAEESEVAKADAQGAFLNGLFTTAQTQPEDDKTEEDSPAHTPEVEPRISAVIS